MNPVQQRLIRLSMVGVTLVSMSMAAVRPARAANVLLNAGFEEGYRTYWTLSEGGLTGEGLGEDPHSGAKSWHGTWNFTGGPQTTTYYQDIPVSAGATVNTSMWCKANAYGGLYGNNTHSFQLRIRFRDAAGAILQTVTGTSSPNNTWQQIVLPATPAPAGTTHARVLFSYITTQMAHAGKVWNIDDLELDAGTGPDQPVLFSASPALVPNNLSNTALTVTGIRLSSVTGVKLTQGATVLTGTNVVVAPDGKSLTAELPTTGAPFGEYDVIVEKAGYAPAPLHKAFRLRDPAGNYLLNGDFEAGPGAGGAIANWGKWYSGWGGTPAIDHLYVAGATDLFIHVPKIGGVDTAVPQGQYSFRSGEYQENGGEGGIYQQVLVTPGEQLALSCKWGGGNTKPGSGMEIGVLKNAHTTAWNYNANDSLGFVRLNDPGSWGWADPSVTFIVPAGVTTVTIYTRLWHNPGSSNWNYVALWADDMQLTATTCPNQHSLAGVNPPAVQTPIVPFDLTVTGTNMDAVTGIRLVRGQDQYAGTISNPSAGQLTAQFTPPVGGFVLGTYDVVTEQTGCLGHTLPQAFIISCNTSFALTGVTPNVLVKPQGVAQLTVNGTNVAGLSQVKLVYVPPVRNPPGDRAPFWVPISEAVGTVVNASNPNAVVMSFNLYNAQAGSYKLVGDTGNTCPDPAEVPAAFELKLPSGANTIANPGFESGVMAPWVLTPEVGNTNKGDPFPGAELALANVGSGPWHNHLAHGGDYLVGIRATHDGTPANWLTPNKGYLRQALGLPNGPGAYQLTLSFWVRMWDQVPEGCSLRASIIADGETPNPITSSVTAALVDLPNMTTDGLDPYTRLSVDFIGNVTTSLAVEFYFEASALAPPEPTPPNWWGTPSSVVVDDIELIGIVPCPVPRFDLDDDGDVDQEDFGQFQVCFSGPSPGEPPLGTCRCLDGDQDGDVDLADLQEFIVCAATSGPMIPANCP